MTIVHGGPVLSHVQACADEVALRFGISYIMTYDKHQPTKERAIDCFGTRDQMLALAMWTTQDDVIDHFGIDYTMFDVNQTTVGSEIYNREKGKYWRQVEDRGDKTQNHHDHCHISFDPTGSATPFGESAPYSHIEKEIEMLVVADASTSRAYLLHGAGLGYIHSNEDLGRLTARVGPIIVLGSNTLSHIPGYIDSQNKEYKLDLE